MSRDGKVTLCPHVDVTMPVRFGEGLMLPVTLRAAEGKSPAELHEAVADVLRCAEKTRFAEAMYEVSLRETMGELRRGRVLCALGRLTGFWLDGGPRALLRGGFCPASNSPKTQKRRYRAYNSTPPRYEIEATTQFAPFPHNRPNLPLLCRLVEIGCHAFAVKALGKGLLRQDAYLFLQKPPF